jgi:SAM-dependent methyltransferase
MTELELIIDLHLQTDRQGPGSKEDTLRALEFVGLSNDLPWAIADIGCGSGGQTITLAEQGLAHITAVDLFEPLLQELNERSRVAGLSKQITTQQCSMESLPFGQESLDLIWSEGAIYNMGFLEGIKAWRKYLKEGGYLAVSEITWTSATRPQKVVRNTEAEIAFYMKYKDYYSYGFYIARKAS